MLQSQNGRREPLRPLKRSFPLESLRLRRVRLERHMAHPRWCCQRCAHTCLRLEAECTPELEVPTEAVPSQEELALRLYCVLACRE